MRTKLVPLVLLVALAAFALVVSPAAARPGPRHPPPTTATHAAKPVPKTAAMLPGSAYPWVQPVWRTVNGVVVVTLPRTIGSANTQPPAWVYSR